MEDSEPASTAAGISYAMFAEDALWYTSLSNKAIEVKFEEDPPEADVCYD
jgi:hypothetical protein